MISICVSVIRGVVSRSKKSIVFIRQYGFGYAPQNARVFDRFFHRAATIDAAGAILRRDVTVQRSRQHVRAFGSRCQSHRKRESLHHGNGCCALRSRLRARRLERARVYEASILLVAWR